MLTHKHVCMCEGEFVCALWSLMMCILCMLSKDAFLLEEKERENVCVCVCVFGG